MRRLTIVAVLALSLFVQQTAGAISLKINPPDYRVTLKSGEKQKGVIDVGNPSGAAVKVTTSVQGFRQIDDQGNLEFYDDPKVSEGVRLDLDNFELGPNETMRMYFLVDGTKLPEGDVYAAVFFTTVPSDRSVGVTQSVRLGTLLSIINGRPGERKADITKLDVPFVQFGDQVTGSYAVKNTSDPKTKSGFYPDVRITMNPFETKQTNTSKLVFAGRERVNDFTVNSSRFGFYKVRVEYNGSAHEAWVLVLNPVGLIIFGLAIVAMISYFVSRWKKSSKK